MNDQYFFAHGLNGWSTKVGTFVSPGLWLGQPTARRDGCPKNLIIVAFRGHAKLFYRLQRNLFFEARSLVCGLEAPATAPYST
jgi:hypothetical protein